MLGPHRVFPGRLSVCRTLGDIEAKHPMLLGNPKVVISDPDIASFKIDPTKHDFLLLGCDGIFDTLDDKEVVHFVWQCLPLAGGEKLLNFSVDTLLKASAMRNSTDNLTVVMVAFGNFHAQMQ
jgi:protein phosphatase PTC2/3